MRPVGWTNWIRTFFASRPSRSEARKSNWRPTLEQLEARFAPAILTVNTTADLLQMSDGKLSLPDAIAAVNAGNLSPLNQAAYGNVAGSFGAADVIQFDLPAGSVIALSDVLPHLTQNVQIL